jgi:hypothetical protein
MKEWVRIDFDRQAVEDCKPARLISTFRESVTVGDSDEVSVFQILPIGEQCTFLFSPAAAALGASVLNGLNKTRCETPNLRTQRLLKII